MNNFNNVNLFEKNIFKDSRKFEEKNEMQKKRIIEILNKFKIILFISCVKIDNDESIYILI